MFSVIIGDSTELCLFNIELMESYDRCGWAEEIKAEMLQISAHQVICQPEKFYFWTSFSPSVMSSIF